MAFSFQARLPADGLVLYLDAANKTSYPGSGTTWYDLSRNGNDVTLAGSTLPSYTTSVGGGSFYFDGVSSRAGRASTPSLVAYPYSTAIAVCKLGNTQGGVVFARAQGGGAGTYGIRDLTNNGAFSFQHTSCEISCPGSPSINAQNFNVYQTVTAGASTGVLYYRNGQYVTTYTGGCYSPSNDPTFPLTLGALYYHRGIGNTGYEAFFKGHIAAVLVYNRVLSADESATIGRIFQGRENIKA